MRRAALTDRSSGKYRATSGDRRIKFVPARKRAVYLPRTAPFSLEKSYSARNVSRSSCFLLVFFIVFSFSWRCFPGANDSDVLPAVGMGHDKKPACGGSAKRDKPLLCRRVVGIVVRDGQRVAEDTGRLAKRNAMFSEISRSFDAIPFERHCSILPHGNTVPSGYRSRGARVNKSARGCNLREAVDSRRGSPLGCRACPP